MYLTYKAKRIEVYISVQIKLYNIPVGYIIFVLCRAKSQPCNPYHQYHMYHVSFDTSLLDVSCHQNILKTAVYRIGLTCHFLHFTSEILLCSLFGRSFQYFSQSIITLDAWNNFILRQKDHSTMLTYLTYHKKSLLLALG